MVRNGTALPLTLRKQMFPAPSPGMRNQGGATMEEDRQWAAQKLAFDLGMQFRDAWKSSRKIGISGGSCGSGAPARGCWSATAHGLTEGPARPFPSLAHPISKCTGGRSRQQRDLQNHLGGQLQDALARQAATARRGGPPCCCFHPQHGEAGDRRTEPAAISAQGRDPSPPGFPR